MRTATLLAGLALWVTAVQAQDAKRTHVGAETCAACHPKQSAAHSRSAHAGALRRAKNHELASEFLSAARSRDGEWSYEFARDADGTLTVRLASTESSTTKEVEWAFGSGFQAVTFVSQLDEDAYVEHHLSYYPRESRFGITPGHHERAIETTEEALGVRYETFSRGSEIMRCFGCHSTGPLALGEEFTLVPAELGVRCESCHGPGSEHLSAVQAGEPERAREVIDNPGRLEPKALMDYCGGCHRPPASDGETIDWRDPWNVRHQPVYLSRSACFQESPSGLACMTCHDPHEPLSRDASHYTAQCTSCHDTSARLPSASCSSEEGCASCHMPAVQPQNELTFHNHWIGVYGEGERFTPRAAKDSRISTANSSEGP